MRQNNWDSDSNDSSDSSYNGYDNDQTYSVWCDYLQEFIEFDSITMPDNVELFNITAIAEYFNQDNKELTLWFEDNVDILQVIDSVTTGCDVKEVPKLVDISEKTINKVVNNWYVNEGVLIEYLLILRSSLVRVFPSNARIERTTPSKFCFRYREKSFPGLLQKLSFISENFSI